MGSENIFELCAYRLTILFSKYRSFFVLLCSLSLWWGGGVVGGGGWFFGDYCVSPNIFVVLYCGCGCGWGWAVTIFIKNVNSSR